MFLFFSTGIPLFESVAASKDDAVFPKLTTDEKITFNEWIFFLCIYDMKLFYFQFPLYLWVFQTQNSSAILTWFLVVAFSNNFCIKNSVLRTSKYSFKLTPAKLYKLRLKIKHTQWLYSKSFQLDNTNWVWQFISLRRNETIGSGEHKILFAVVYKTNTRTGFCFISLNFIQQKIDSGKTFFFVRNKNLWIKNKPFSCLH